MAAIIFFSNVTGTITLLSPLPALAANITITGPGTNLLTVSGNNQFHVFCMNTGTTNTLSGLTIADGMAEGDSSLPRGLDLRIGHRERRFFEVAELRSAELHEFLKLWARHLQ